MSLSNLLAKIFEAVVLLLPLVFAGIAHMILLKQNFFPAAAIPICQKWFGANKTWRGFILMPVLTAIFMVMVALAIPSIPIPQSLNCYSGWLALGHSLGLGYVLFELPNSFLKRRLGIAPGEPSKKFFLFFFLLDRFDSAVGCSIVYLLFGIDPVIVALLLPVGVVIHIIVTFVLLLLRVKEKI